MLNWELNYERTTVIKKDARIFFYVSQILNVILNEPICELKKAKYVSFMLDRSIETAGTEV